MDQDDANTPKEIEPALPAPEHEQKQPLQDAVDENGSPSPAQDELTRKQPVLAGVSQNPPAGTKVFLGDQSSAGPAIYNDDTVAHAPVVPPQPLPSSSSAPTAPGTGYAAPRPMAASGIPRNPSRPPRTRSKAVWWLIGIPGVLAALIVIFLLGAGLFAFASHSSFTTPISSVSSTPHTITTPPSASSSPFASTPVSTATAVANPYLAVIPNHFNVRNDCVVDNGYRCTAVIVASQLMSGSASWFISSSTLSSKFSPASGVLYANQQQQVIIYLYNACPYSGSLMFSTSRGNVTVPVVC